MSLPRGTPSCLPSHQSGQPAQVSSAGRTGRGTAARFPSSRWVGRLEEEVSGTPGDSLTAALPETTKVIGWWNDRPHSYPCSRGQGNIQGSSGGRISVACFTLFWSLSLFVGVKTSSCVLPFTFNTSTVLKSPEEKLVLEHGMLYKGILVKLRLTVKRAEK